MGPAIYASNPVAIVVMVPIQWVAYYSTRCAAPVQLIGGRPFWLVDDWAVSHAEIDIIEICANPPRTNDGNDVTILHQIVHASATKAYSLDGRPDHIEFYFDGRLTYRYSDAATIPSVSMTPILSLELGVGVVVQTQPLLRRHR